jgi:hypothetical protein
MAVSEQDDGADFLAALDRLTPLAQAYSTEPISLFGHLAAIAQGWGIVAGDVNAAGLRRQLWRRGLGLRRPAAREQRDRLNDIDADAVWRGPIAALGLATDLGTAEQLLGCLRRIDGLLGQDDRDGVDGRVHGLDPPQVGPRSLLDWTSAWI